MVDSKIIFGIALALILTGSAIFYQQDTQESKINPTSSVEPKENASKPQNRSNTVRFTDNGFNPSTLTIQKGEEVVFLDESSRTMWVATDNHPTHTKYDGTSLRSHCSGSTDTFDQCETGSSFSFTFNKTGSFGYHNHKPFVSGGTIIVE